VGGGQHGVVEDLVDPPGQVPDTMLHLKGGTSFKINAISEIEDGETEKVVKQDTPFIEYLPYLPR